MSLTHLDVLVYLPKGDVRGLKHAFMAVSMQCNISALGGSPEEAVAALVVLVKKHLELSEGENTNPYSAPESHITSAFFAATPMEQIYAQVQSRLTKDAKKLWGSIGKEVRGITEYQQEKRELDLALLFPE